MRTTNDKRQKINTAPLTESFIRLAWRRGFTIVELLVVISIIMLVGSLIFLQLQVGRQKARDAEREQEVKSLQNALALYVVNRGKYPSPYTALAVTGSDPVTGELTGEGALGGGIFDPINVAPYQYVYDSPTDGSSYGITYYLETDSIKGKSAGMQTAGP